MDSGERLVTLELPFSYIEHGQDKFALVKVVLCEKCCKKLMWKRTKEKEKEKGKQKETVEGEEEGDDPSEADKGLGSLAGEASDTVRRDVRRRKPVTDDKRRRSSRSLSPRSRERIARLPRDRS
jgi:protein FRA10AC1